MEANSNHDNRHIHPAAVSFIINIKGAVWCLTSGSKGAATVMLSKRMQEILIVLFVIAIVLALVFFDVQQSSGQAVALLSG